MKCQNCGAELNNGELFCKNCGAKVESTTETNANTTTTQISNTTTKKKKYWWITIILCSSFFIFTILNLILMIYISNLPIETDSNLISVLKGISGVMSFFAIFLPMIGIISIPIVIILNNKSTPEEKKEINNLINDTNANIDDRLLAAYIGNNYNKIIQKKFSWPAFIFNAFYVAYRKVYIQTIVIYIILEIATLINNFLGGVLPLLSSLLYLIIIYSIMFLLGKNFNKLYIDYSKKQIEKIKQENPNDADNDLIRKCQAKGGTSIWAMIGIIILASIISSIISNAFPKTSTSSMNANNKIQLIINK